MIYFVLQGCKPHLMALMAACRCGKVYKKRKTFITKKYKDEYVKTHLHVNNLTLGSIHQIQQYTGNQCDCNAIRSYNCNHIIDHQCITVARPMYSGTFTTLVCFTNRDSFVQKSILRRINIFYQLAHLQIKVQKTLRNLHRQT